MTPEELGRLRSWANRIDPDLDERGHDYHYLCPWCRGDRNTSLPDGNSHTVALRLLDEIDRLRREVERLEAEAEYAGFGEDL